MTHYEALSSVREIPLGAHSEMSGSYDVINAPYHLFVCASEEKYLSIQGLEGPRDSRDC
jgi:hypothetical protein